MVAKISSKGQITIPKFVRELLEVDTGDKVIFRIEEDKICIDRANFNKLKLNDE